jgi:hypothetical protein
VEELFQRFLAKYPYMLAETYFRRWLHVYSPEKGKDRGQMVGAHVRGVR